MARREKKSCSNCKYIHCFTDDDGIDKRHCTNNEYLFNKHRYTSMKPYCKHHEYEAEHGE